MNSFLAAPRSKTKKTDVQKYDEIDKDDMTTGMGIVRAMPGQCLPLLLLPGAWH